MTTPIEATASYLYTTVLEADDSASLDRATNEWLDAHIANEVVSMQLATGGTPGPAGRLYLLIVYKGERRVRHS